VVHEAALGGFVEPVGGVEQAVDSGVTVARLEPLGGAEQLSQSCGIVLERLACGQRRSGGSGRTWCCDGVSSVTV
jgi:hypothetical protein